MKKKTLSLLIFSFSVLTSFAQTAKEEIYADILKSGSNHMAYQVPTTPLTKAPKGYEPFYMSHYGRHGSRWLINDNDYLNVIKSRTCSHHSDLKPTRNWNASIPPPREDWANSPTSVSSSTTA